MFKKKNKKKTDEAEIREERQEISTEESEEKLDGDNEITLEGVKTSDENKGEALDDIEEANEEVENTDDIEDSEYDIWVEEDEVNLDEEEVILDEDGEDIEKDGESQKFSLYVLVDKDIKNLYRAFYDRGVNVEKILYEIEDINRELLIARNKIRLVVIETGTGKFSSTSARKKLVDTIGILDEDDRVTFIYSEELIYESVKENVKRQSFKWIDWVRYRSSMEAIMTIKEYNEEYEGKYREHKKKGVSLERKCSNTVINESTEKFKYRETLMKKEDCYKEEDILEDDRMEYEY